MANNSGEMVHNEIGETSLRTVKGCIIPVERSIDLTVLSAEHVATKFVFELKGDCFIP